MRPLLLAAALLVPAAATAQPYDPAFRWRTVDTEHFQVHFHEGEEALAQRVAGAAERAHARLVPLLRFAPRERTQVVLSDDMDSANGMATPLPYDTIRLYAVAPPGRSELNDHRDWVQTLVEHEYAHILQLDNVGGVPRLFNRIFGKLWVPNGLLPAWMVEGIAVLHESSGDPETGRNAGALYDMYARALVMEAPGLPSLNQATHPSLDWPTGDIPYLLGGKLLESLHRRGGDAAIATFVADQGSRIWPWAPSSVARRAWGKELPSLWRDLHVELIARYKSQLAEVRRRPVTRAAPLTRRGAQIENPRWSPDGTSVAWLERSLDERGGLRRATAAGADLGLAFPVDATGSFALRSPTEAIVSFGEVWHEFRYYEDLWKVDLASGERRRLTDGERATDPDVLPGGDAVVYVARTPGGGMELRRRKIDGGPAETLLSRPGAQLYSPRLSPDGTRVAFELHEGGRRDLALLEGGAVTRVTDDDALDLDPAWSPDGTWLYFASDRGGIFNLYARGEDGTVRQVTNVESGALEPAPSPDGKTLAFVSYSRSGYDVATLPVDAASWLDPLPAPAARPYEPPAEGPALPARPYSPLSTLYPRWWLPTYGADASGRTWGAMTGGADVLGRHAYSLQGWYSVESEQVGYYASYQGGWSWPLVDAWSARQVTTAQGLPWRLEEEWTPLAPAATFTFTRVSSWAFARVGWVGTLFRSLDDEPTSLAIPSAHRFSDGFLSALTLSLGWTDGRQYHRSISREEGALALLDLQVAEPSLGSEYSTSRARAVVAGYRRVPGTRHWVLAGRLAGGVASGSLGGRAPFRLGGLSLQEAGGATTTTFLLGGQDTLRGYRVGSLIGNGFLLANAELRFPLARPELGRTTWPIFLRRLHGAVFVDVGDAFEVGDPSWLRSHALAFDSLQAGVGAELRLELFLAYYLPVELRFGVAQGLGSPFGSWSNGLPAEDPRATTQYYATIGPAF